MTRAHGVACPAKGNRSRWETPVQGMVLAKDISQMGSVMAFRTRVRAMHLWIRRGNAERAASMARLAARHAFYLLKDRTET